MDHRSSDDPGRKEQHPNATSLENQWPRSTTVLESDLPAVLQAALGRFLGDASIETLDDWTESIRDRLDNGTIGRAQLCTTEHESEHWGEIAGDRLYFACFYDAIILAALEDSPVDIRTVSPNGTVVTARAVGSDRLHVSPAPAVFSFGIDAAATPLPETSTPLEQGYAAICPYVRAFPDRDAYDAWAHAVDAPTVAMPLEGATAIAEALVD